MKKIIISILFILFSSLLFAEQEIASVNFASIDDIDFFLTQEEQELVPFIEDKGLLIFELESYYLNVKDDDSLFLDTVTKNQVTIDILIKEDLCVVLLSKKEFVKKYKMDNLSQNLDLGIRYVMPDHDGGGRCYGRCANDKREAYINRHRDQHSKETQEIVDRARAERMAKDYKDIKNAALTGAAIGIAGWAGGIKGAAAATGTTILNWLRD